MTIKSADLEIMATRISQYPEGGLHEFLLVGRRNVVKSSFINCLLVRKNLAYTSSKPGKTQTLNFYLINKNFYLVDVPGYGYAMVSKEKQKKFGMMIEEYLKTRKQLKRVFMLVDFRIKPTEDDVLMYNYLKYYNIPVTIIATKADKVGGSKKEKCLKQIMDTIDLVLGDDLIVFSSNTRLGKNETLNKIESLVDETI